MVHQTAQGVGHDVGCLEVPVGTRLTERRDGRDHQPGVGLSQRRMVQAQFFGAGRGVVLHQDVGVGYKLVEQAASADAGWIEGNPLLVGVQIKE